MNKIKDHAVKMGTHIIEVTKIDDIQINNEIISVSSEDGVKFKGKTCILATGTTHRELNVPGEKEFFGRGISYCSTCDGPFFKNKKVAVIGGGNSACISARYLDSSLKAEVHLIHRKDRLRGEQVFQDAINSNQGISKYWDSTVEEIRGKQKVETILLRNLKTKKREEIRVDGVFINIGEIPNNDLAKKLELDLDPEGYIIVDRNQETSRKGIFAAGDITGGVLQTCVAVGEGATAAVQAYLYINSGWYGQLKVEDL